VNAASDCEIQSVSAADAGTGNDSVKPEWMGNSCIMMNLPQESGRLTQR
jgi:hypothetical protein